MTQALPTEQKHGRDMSRPREALMTEWLALPPIGTNGTRAEDGRSIWPTVLLCLSVLAKVTQLHQGTDVLSEVTALARTWLSRETAVQLGALVCCSADAERWNKPAHVCYSL